MRKSQIKNKNWNLIYLFYNLVKRKRLIEEDVKPEDETKKKKGKDKKGKKMKKHVEERKEIQTIEGSYK